MALLQWARLPGPSSHISEPLRICPHCQGKEFYRQPDFKRSLGLSIVVVASVLTLFLEMISRATFPDWSPFAKWSLVWSPMLIALLVDRVFINRWADTVLICYKCEHIFRGVPSNKLEGIYPFDLEIHDRYRYAEQNEASQPQ